MKGYCIELQAATKIDGGDNVPLLDIFKPQNGVNSRARFTHWSVGTMPDTAWPAASGKLVGITGVTPLTVKLDVSAPLLCCCTGVLIAVAPPGKDSDVGEVNTVACFALDG